MAVANITKRAAAGAFVAHDHEGGDAFAKAFADVGAAGFLAHGVEFVLAQDLLDFVKAGGGRAGFDANPFRLFQNLCLLNLDGDACELCGSLLLGASVISGRWCGFANDGGEAGDVQKSLWSLHE